MTYEEGKAIERLNRFKTIKVLYTKTFAMTTEQLKVIQEDIETVLSMLKDSSAEIKKKNTELAEKSAEIEELKQTLARNIAKNFTSSMKELAKAKQDLEMLNKGWQIELEKKDNIIDLMVKAMDKIQDPQVCKYCDNKINLNYGYCVDAGKCKEGIKQYFERKATNNG